MPDLVLVLLKYAFLLVLYIFIARAVRAMYLELRPATSPAAVRGSAPPPQKKRSKKPPKKLAVIEGENLKGKSFDLGDELIVGRGEKSHIVLDDSYVSTVHARIFARADQFMVEDMGSTNGTYLNRRRITAPTELQRGDRLKIGKTVMELR
jgi:pSer/pThr/pTyr-binding forkhead associated (FHA) protein